MFDCKHRSPMVLLAVSSRHVFTTQLYACVLYTYFNLSLRFEIHKYSFFFLLPLSGMETHFRYFDFSLLRNRNWMKNHKDQRILEIIAYLQHPFEFCLINHTTALSPQSYKCISSITLSCSPFTSLLSTKYPLFTSHLKTELFG